MMRYFTPLFGLVALACARDAPSRHPNDGTSPTASESAPRMGVAAPQEPASDSAASAAEPKSSGMTVARPAEPGNDSTTPSSTRAQEGPPAAEVPHSMPQPDPL